MALNTNIGPERVEVTLSPIGTVLPQGAATARTAILIATDFAAAPLNTPITVTSLSQFEQIFGKMSNMGESYLCVKGYYDNAGVGTELVVVAVEPSGIAGAALESAEALAIRTISGFLSQIVDSGTLVSQIQIDSYSAITGVCELDLTSATSNLSEVRVGDFLQDANFKLFPILAINGDKITIQAGLDPQMVKSNKSSPSLTATANICRLYEVDKFNGKTCLQKGEEYGTAISATVSGDVVTLVNYDAYLNNVTTGDVITTATGKEFLIIDVIDSNEVQVDRLGMPAGVVSLNRGVKNKIIQNRIVPGLTELTIGVAPIAASEGEVIFNIVNSSILPAKSSLKDKYVRFSDGATAQITDNTIVANNSLPLSTFAAAISYAPTTGEVTLPAAAEVITDGVKVGDVLVDSQGKEYIIQEVIAEDKVRIDKNIASPNPLAGAKISKGMMELKLANNVDFSAKVIGEPAADTSGEIASKANSLIFADGIMMESDSYFIMEPAVTSSDFIGSEADESGLYALEAVAIINLVAIPGIYDPAVQAALSDYCSITRHDCLSLISIPEFINSAANDKLVVGNLSISSIVDTEQGVILTFAGTPNLAQVSTYDILQVGSKKFTVKTVDNTNHQVILFQTTGVPLTGAVAILSPSAVSWKDIIVNKPSTKAAWYYNHLVVANPEGGQAIIDPVLHVAGIMNRMDRNIAMGGVSHAPAGIQFAQIAGIIGLQLEISEKKDGGPLRLAYINRITSSTGNGRYIFGAYTAGGNSVTPDEKLVQVMRSLMFIKNSLEPGLIGFIWENNSPVTRQNIANAVLNFLRANAYLFPSGLPENEQFQVELVTPTQTDIDQGLVQVKVKCRFNTAIRFIDIDLQFPLPQAEA